MELISIEEGIVASGVSVEVTENSKVSLEVTDAS